MFKICNIKILPGYSNCTTFRNGWNGMESKHLKQLAKATPLYNTKNQETRTKMSQKQRILKTKSEQQRHSVDLLDSFMFKRLKNQRRQRELYSARTVVYKNRRNQRARKKIQQTSNRWLQTYLSNSRSKIYSVRHLQTLCARVVVHKMYTLYNAC
jgi:hypothetical protein